MSYSRAVLSIAVLLAGWGAQACSHTVAEQQLMDAGIDAATDADLDARIVDEGIDAATLDAGIDARPGDSGRDAEASCATLTPPPSHRPTATACPSTRPPAMTGSDAGPVGPDGRCSDDSQCAQADAGVNGRCEAPPSEGDYDAGQTCSYDTCFSDKDCPPATLCQCSEQLGNACLPSNCRVDSDCACGFCSPSPGDLGGCFPAFGTGITGYYCHTVNDDCTTDAECDPSDSGFSVCAWQPTVAKWACASTMCAG